jgi:hypothetical protein
MLGLRLLKGAALGRLECSRAAYSTPFLHPTTLGCVFTGQASLSAPTRPPRSIKSSPPQRPSSLAYSMRQLPACSECSHEKHDAPKVLRLDHLHRVITTNGAAPQADEAQRAGRSFDHLVRAGEQRRRNFDAERFGGFKIDYQLVF